MTVLTSRIICNTQNCLSVYSSKEFIPRAPDSAKLTGIKPAYFEMHGYNLSGFESKNQIVLSVQYCRVG